MPNLEHPRRTPLLFGKTFSTSAMLMVMALTVSLGSFVVAQSRAATVYTVSPGQSLSSAIGQLKAGDTLIVKGGSYSGTVTGSPSGTSSAPITVKAAPGEKPVLSGLVRLTGASYFTWDGINVAWPSSAGSSDHMFKMTSGSHWRITNSDIGGAHSYAGVLVAGTPSGWSIDHNRIHDTYPSNSSNQDHLIYVNGGTGGGMIERNVFYNSTNGRGVKIGPPSGGSSPIGNVTIRYNSFYNNLGPSNIQLSYGASNNTIYRNIMVKSGSTNITAYNLNGSGNVAYDNIGFQGSGIGQFGGGLKDGGGNKAVDPQYASATDLHPRNTAVSDYGAYAPGSSAPAPTSAPTPAPTPVVTPVPDTTKPTSNLTAPTAGTTVSGTVTVSATATDNVKVAKVQFMAGNTAIATDTTGTGSAYSATWNTASATNGTVTLTAIATDSAGNATTSAPVSVTVKNSTSDTTSPSAPTGLNVTSTSASTVAFSWTAAKDNVGVSAYEVFRDGVSAGRSTTTSFSDSALTPGTTYAYYVVAIDAAGNRSVPSLPLMATTSAGSDTQAPSAPTGLQGSISGGRITVTWTPSTDNTAVKDYVVVRSGVTVGTVTTPSFTDTVLPAGTYVYVIVARDASGNLSSPSATLSVTLVASGDTQAPSAPTGLAAASVSTTEIDLAWNPSSDNVGVVAYNVYRDGTKLATVSTTSFGDATNTPGSSHVYTVTALDAAGNQSGASNSVTATSSSNAVAAAITGIAKASTSSAGSISLSRPANVEAGTVLVATLDVRGQPTVSAPTGWTLVRKDIATAGNTMVKYTFSHTAALTEPSTYTFKFSNSSSASAMMAAVAGVKDVTPKATGQVGSSANKISAPSISSTEAGAIVLGFFGQANDATVSAPSDMTKLGQILNTGGSDVVSQLSLRTLPTASSTGTETATSSKSAIGIGQLVVLEQN